ncbi:MAG: DUF1269 domain-containing protein [Acidimicrobiia bacterium]|nr:DUF1269 domain-containing protein [Acidimicrobiia bacterium]
MGPVQILVVSFPGNEFNGDVVPSVAELLESGLIRLIDLVFLTKDREGNVVALEMSDIDDAVGAAFGAHIDQPSGLIAEEDIDDLAEDLELESSAVILLFEHVWATRFRDAVVNSGGEIVSSIPIPLEVIEEVLAAS